MNNYTFAFILVACACIHHSADGFSPSPPSSLSLPQKESRQSLQQLNAQWSPNKELFSKSMFSFQQQPLWYDNHHPTARSIVYHDDAEDAFTLFAAVGSDWELADPNEHQQQSPRVPIATSLSQRPLWRRLLSRRRRQP